MLSQQNLQLGAGAGGRRTANAVVQMGKNSWHRAAHSNAFGGFFSFSFSFLMLQAAVLRAWTLRFMQKIKTSPLLTSLPFFRSPSIWSGTATQVTKPRLGATKLLSNTAKSSLELTPDRAPAGAGTPSTDHGCPTLGQAPSKGLWLGVSRARAGTGTRRSGGKAAITTEQQPERSSPSPKPLCHHHLLEGTGADGGLSPPSPQIHQAESGKRGKMLT